METHLSMPTLCWAQGGGQATLGRVLLLCWPGGCSGWRRPWQAPWRGDLTPGLAAEEAPRPPGVLNPGPPHSLQTLLHLFSHDPAWQVEVTLTATRQRHRWACVGDRPGPNPGLSPSAASLSVRPASPGC